jgi:hypothetical protein
MDDEILMMDDEILIQIKSKISKAQTIEELQVYVSELQRRIHFLKSRFKSKPPDTSQVFNNHFC